MTAGTSGKLALLWRWDRQARSEAAPHNPASVFEEAHARRGARLCGKPPCVA